MTKIAIAETTEYSFEMYIFFMDYGCFLLCVMNISPE